MQLKVDITKKLRNFTLHANFTMQDEVFALLGASGCGKSMTLKCIAGLATPDSGHIELDGQVLYDSAQGIDLPPQARHIGYLFQSYALFPNMTIRENIRFVAVGTPEEKEQKIAAGLRRFHLEELADAYPAELSGGQQQRAALARILAADAKLLLLDEPFSALDNYLKWQLELELLDVLQAYNGAAIFVSHDRGEVYRLADRAAVISRGQMEAPRRRQELFHNPGTLAATVLTGCKNVSAAQVTDQSNAVVTTAEFSSTASSAVENIGQQSGGMSQVEATDWQLMLQVETVPRFVRYVGIRAHFLAFCASGDVTQVEAAQTYRNALAQGGGDEAAADAVQRPIVPANIQRLQVTRVIEDVFSYLVMVRRAGAPEARPLRWELPKADWHHIAPTLPADQTLWLYFLPDKIMLMEQ